MIFNFSSQDGDVVYSNSLKAFGVRPKLDYEPASCGKCITLTSLLIIYMFIDCFNHILILS